MPLESLLKRWKSDPSIGPNISAWHTFPAQKPLFVDFPPELDSRLQNLLRERGIPCLYAHQRATWDAIQNGRNVVLSTGTSSGKSLAYQLPILNTILSDPLTTALLLFPTKALARDQLTWFEDFPVARAYAYDGDTPPHRRKAVRESANIVITNPDMLHLGILPYHPSWAAFFSHLKYIILDEIHIYRGVFGSHVANVIRRLKRLAAYYGSEPQFMLTSATIGNPRQLAEALIASHCELISEDSSGRGVRHFLVYNPPIVDASLGLRASMQRESVRLASDLLASGLQTIIFGRSRRSVEFLLSSLRAASNLPESALQSYRSGYLPVQRREIEKNLRTGIIRGITATTALELGIDIGGLEGAILTGYPGSIAGTRQQAGRAGRSEKPSIAILVVSSNPLDQFLAFHPDFLFENNPENALLNADNLLIALAHLQCAAYELPLKSSTSFGSFSNSEVQELLELLQRTGKLHFSGDKFYWISSNFPAGEISLRSSSANKITLQVSNTDGNSYLLGTVDYESALWMVHPGAIYLHSGETYLVEELDLEQEVSKLHPTAAAYYTEPEKKTSFELLELLDEKTVPGANKYYGSIRVSTQVVGFKKINWDYYEVLGMETLDLPPTVLNTAGFWITLSYRTEAVLRESGLWSSSPNQYGPDWGRIRAAVLERDGYSCAICGRSGAELPLHVHHKIPLRSFSSYQEANQLDNLIALCPVCHQRAEAAVRVNSGIRGLAYILHNLAPLLLMCDPGDLGVYSDFQSPFGNSRPFALLYESIPAGIGFSRHLFEHFAELLDMSFQTITSCPCENGCPSCVGPGGTQGSGSKLETLALLIELGGHT